jgi:hypothetical protein
MLRLQEQRNRQEEQCLQIERNMARLMITSEELKCELSNLDRYTSDVEIEAECELLDMTHIYGSTMPSLLHQDYATRLSMTEKINQSIYESLQRKSRRQDGQDGQKLLAKKRKTESGITKPRIPPVKCMNIVVCSSN